MQKLCCVCTRQQFSASLDYFVTSLPPYLHQFSTIFGGNCIKGQHSYGQGQPYHPYSRAPIPGRGHGCGRRGSNMYQVQMDVLPPVASDPHRPEGSPPDDLHFADGDYDQNAALTAPELERWVIGYSNDLGTPQDSEYPPGSIYEYAPKSYHEENQDQDYYYGDEE